MGSSTKRRMTAEKRAREQKRKERRELKEEKKAARKQAANDAEAPGNDEDVSGPVDPLAAGDES